MEKTDFKKTDKFLYTGKVGRFDIINVPSTPYLMIDGEGAPGSPDFGRSIAALYGLSYGLKFYSKKTIGKDYVVPPLEGLWWADDMGVFITRAKETWKWTLMIRQPDWISKTMLDDIRAVTIAKNAKKKQAPTDTDSISKVRLETLDEGLCVQILHVGPFDDEGPVLEQMHKEFIPDNGYTLRGKHHEIYLSDFRKVKADKLKTILRQPVG